MSSQQYCLRWNNHQSNMLGVFSRLLGSERFTDVVLAAEDGIPIRAHRVVLSACSSYFERLFEGCEDVAPSGAGSGIGGQIVILKDTSIVDLNAIVQFMYKGEINVAQERLASLLKTAESLRVKGLAEVSTTPTAASSSSPTTDVIQQQFTAEEEVVSPAKKPSAASNNDLKTHHNNNKRHFKPPLHAAAAAPPPLMHPPQPRALEMVKRKRGRPRTLDSPGELPDPCFASPSSTSNSPPILPSNLPLPLSLAPPPPAAAAAAAVTTAASSSSSSSSPSGSTAIVRPTSPPSSASAAKSEGGGLLEEPHLDFENGNVPTPGGPLTPERVSSLGVLKLNDYLASGTRQQFWEEYFVKVIMQAVRNKELDMKGAAELLGVSYGTLYGRYRETFGYLKHAWNIAGRPGKSFNSLSQSPLASMFAAAAATASTSSASPTSEQEKIFEQLTSGRINFKQAGNLLGVEPAMLAYQLALKASDEFRFPFRVKEEDLDEDEYEEDELRRQKRHKTDEDDDREAQDDDDEEDEVDESQDNEDEERETPNPMDIVQSNIEDDENEAILDKSGSEQQQQQQLIKRETSIKS